MVGNNAVQVIWRKIDRHACEKRKNLIAGNRVPPKCKNEVRSYANINGIFDNKNKPIDNIFIDKCKYIW